MQLSSETMFSAPPSAARIAGTLYPDLPMVPATAFSTLAAVSMSRPGVFLIEAGDGEAEDGIVDREQIAATTGTQIPLGGQAMQNAKHHEVDDIAVGVADGYPGAPP